MAQRLLLPDRLAGIPGRVEGFGLVYLEAAACGLPSIATAIGGVPDAVLTDETGILVPPKPRAFRWPSPISPRLMIFAPIFGGRRIRACAISFMGTCAAATYGLSYAGTGEAIRGDRCMKRLAVVAIFFTLAGTRHGPKTRTAARAANTCWVGLGGDLTLPPQAYNDLFKICTAATVMPNVRDAYVLKDGGIAVVAKQDSVAATAATLAQFCDDYPRAPHALPHTQGTAIGQVGRQHRANFFHLIDTLQEDQRSFLNSMATGRDRFAGRSISAWCEDRSPSRPCAQGRKTRLPRRRLRGRGRFIEKPQPEKRQGNQA